MLLDVADLLRHTIKGLRVIGLIKSSLFLVENVQSTRDFIQDLLFDEPAFVCGCDVGFDVLFKKIVQEDLLASLSNEKIEP